jgi:hypothetical protein
MTEEMTISTNEEQKRKRGRKPGVFGRYSKSYYMANREKFRGWALKYNFRNIERVLLCSARVRAKKKNIPFDIDVSDIVVPTHCPVLGIPIFVTMRENQETKRNLPNSPSLDRIQPKLGYVRGNVQVISWRANDLKKDATLEELKALVLHLQKLEDQ